jgi:hypothetical protein
MELQTAIEILEYHQEWRLGKREDMIHEPKKLTEALDIVLSEVKKIPVHNVSNRYSIEDIEKCVENWGMCKVEKEYIERFLNGC